MSTELRSIPVSVERRERLLGTGDAVVSRPGVGIPGEGHQKSGRAGRALNLQDLPKRCFHVPLAAIS